MNFNTPVLINCPDSCKTCSNCKHYNPKGLGGEDETDSSIGICELHKCFTIGRGYCIAMDILRG